MSTTIAFLLIRLALSAVLMSVLAVILIELRRGLRAQAPGGMAQPQATLIEDGPPEAKTPILLEATNTIGRALGNTITLDHPSVSSYHARLSFGSGHWLLEDLGSRNGTRLNGIEVGEPMIVTHGDLVQFGAVGFHLRVGAPDGGMPSAPTRINDARTADRKADGRDS